MIARARLRRSRFPPVRSADLEGRQRGRGRSARNLVEVAVSARYSYVTCLTIRPSDLTRTPSASEVSLQRRLRRPNKKREDQVRTTTHTTPSALGQLRHRPRLLRRQRRCHHCPSARQSRTSQRRVHLPLQRRQSRCRNDRASRRQRRPGLPRASGRPGHETSTHRPSNKESTGPVHRFASDYTARFEGKDRS